jgi:hypothetical protein
MAPQETVSYNAERPSPGGLLDAASTRSFVRTPFAVRRHVIMVWRRLPSDLWTTLSQPGDRTRSVQVERRALGGVAVMAVVLIAGFSSVGLRITVDEADLCFPLLGWSVAAVDGSPDPGWYYAPGQSLSLALWVVAPSLAGWALVRLIWIPMVVTGKPTAQAALAFARHLGAVYFYVYLMISVGAALMVPLVALAPRGTETFRWCLWCFLFGESFFVPAAMWLRMVIHDSSGQVFGRLRYAGLTLYMALCVAIPILGMVQELE